MTNSGRKLLLLPPLLFGASVLSGCAGKASRPATAAQQPVIGAERSSRGNPPFYEVFGERYYVLDSSNGFRQRGIASWYGPDFHGQPTSSGEVYDMYEMTAAHKTLPLPTWVEVTNQANGRSVIVKVNDRGPFVSGRVIDLSLRAAEELDMVRNGTAEVTVRALGAPAVGSAERVETMAEARPESEPERRRGFSLISTAEAAAPGPDDRPLRPMYVQVGAYSDRNNATRMAQRLKDEGFSDSFVLTSGEGRERLHRVRIGPLGSATEFDRIQADLRAAGVQGSRLVQDN